VNGTASILLLFVAAGLLILAGAGVGRARGRALSRSDAALMAGMTGVTIGFLGMLLSASMLLLGPIAIAAVLLATWASRGRTELVGAFLAGAGLIVAGMQAWAFLNDVSDRAVSIPGWTPVPLATGAAVAILGATLLVAASFEARSGDD
jgi:hypothetical protein